MVVKPASFTKATTARNTLSASNWYSYCRLISQMMTKRLQFNPKVFDEDTEKLSVNNKTKDVDIKVDETKEIQNETNKQAIRSSSS